MKPVSLSVTLCGVTLKNPLIAASGCFGFGTEYQRFFDVSSLGGIALKAVTAERREGNPPPRIVETASGILNAVGLQNPGVDAFLTDKYPDTRKIDTVLIANVSGSTVEEYCAVARKLSATALDMLELNISCPNVKAGGLAFGSDPATIRAVTAAVRAVCGKPLIVKLSPAVSDIGAAAAAAQDGGADAVSLINTIPAMAIDARARRAILGNTTGGLSGRAIKPVALRMVYLASRAVDIPVIGMGGIMTGEDIAEFMLAGATAVMAGTAFVADPCAGPRLLDELRQFCQSEGTDDVTSLTGALR